MAQNQHVKMLDLITKTFGHFKTRALGYMGTRIFQESTIYNPIYLIVAVLLIAERK